MPPGSVGSIVASNLNIVMPLPPEQDARLFAPLRKTVLSWHWRPAGACLTYVASVGSDILIFRTSIHVHVPLEPPL